MHRSTLAVVFGVVIGIAVLLTVASCATWQTDTKKALRGAYETTKVADGFANTIMHARCMEIAKTCAVQSPGKCPKLTECQKTKHAIEGYATGVYRMVITGLLAVELGEKKSAAEYMQKAVQMLSEINKALKETGVL